MCVFECVCMCVWMCALMLFSVHVCVLCLLQCLLQCVCVRVFVCVCRHVCGLLSASSGPCWADVSILSVPLYKWVSMCFCTCVSMSMWTQNDPVGQGSCMCTKGQRVTDPWPRLFLEHYLWVKHLPRMMHGPLAPHRSRCQLWCTQRPDTTQ